MNEALSPFFLATISLLELAGVVVVVIGFALAGVRWLAGLRSRPSHAGYLHFRRGSVRALILGLEFLVAADVIRTVTIDYSVASVVELGLIVLIRTFLVLALHVEIEGYWPWRPPPADIDGGPR